MKSLYRTWLSLWLLLACAPLAAQSVDRQEIRKQAVELAGAGDPEAMRSLVEGRAQVRFGAFGRRSFVPYQVTGTSKGNEYKYSWQPAPAEVLTWLQRAADAGLHDMQRFLVLCHHFGCPSCSANQRNEQTCSSEHGIARDPARAQQLARDYRAGSAQPASWDALQALLDEWATLEPRAQRGDGAAASRLAELAGQASSLGSLSARGLRLGNLDWQKHWSAAAVRLGDPSAIEKVDPAARQAGLAKRWRERVQAALEQEAQEQRRLLGASQAR